VRGDGYAGYSGHIGTAVRRANRLVGDARGCRGVGRVTGVHVEPYPRHRRAIVDAVRMGRRRNTVYGLLEFDVTLAREHLRAHAAATGQSLSFTAFLLGCYGRALAEHPEVHAYRDWRNRLVSFDTEDVTVLVETELDGRKVALPHVFRDVGARSVSDLDREMQAVKRQPGERLQHPLAPLFVRFPGVVRRQIYRLPRLSPRRWQRVAGSAALTAVGMFGEGGGWGIGTSVHTVQLLVGGIAEKPGVVDGRIEPREYLSVTLAFDHDVVDGAPAARFATRLETLVESGYGLEARRSVPA
jgi:pyruvate/2-oxoglutarate dehydrogenase complex dihydrolipoamide acyltransferase (E2) component